MATTERTGRFELQIRRVLRTPLSYGCLLLGALGCQGVVDGSGLGNSGMLGPNNAAGTSSGSTPGGGNSSGSASGTGASGGASSGPGGTLQSFTCATGSTPDPGASPLSLLSRTQYLNTLNGLFSKLPDLTTALGADTNYSVAFGAGQADIDQVQVGGFQVAAETIATAVAADPKQLAALAPCTGTDKRVCAQSFLQSFGALAYRAPITDPADIARHMAVYDAGAKVSDAHGLQLLLEAMLQSPRFLYRVELGTKEAVGANAVKLSPYEIAARLAYLVWDSAPDAMLTAAATAGQLATKDQVAAQLTRMIADPKGAKFVRRFLEGWTQVASVSNLVKDSTLYPSWSAAGSTLPASVKAQASAFFDNVLGAGNGNLQALLTSTTVFVNKDMASYYGATSTDAAFTPLTVTNGQVSGLLTLPALLSVQAKPDESWPIYRGRFVREELFCQDMPSPPPNIPKPPDVMPGVSTRERLTQHEVNPSCSGCHALMDPIGFGFEGYDSIGHYRTTDGGKPVDTSGTISGGTDVDGAFNGVVDLGKKLAGSTKVRECVARQWFRFATDRREVDTDSCTMKSISDAFVAAGNNINALPQALVQSDAFLYRRPIQVSQ